MSVHRQIVPDTYEQPDPTKGLPIYNKHRRILAYNIVTDARRYSPILVNDEVCGWIGPSDGHRLPRTQPRPGTF